MSFHWVFLLLVTCAFASPLNLQKFLANHISSELLSYRSYEHELISLHKSLVEIESITGNEHEVGEFLTEYLRKNGFNVLVQNVEGNRNNIYAYLGDSLNYSKVLLTSHIDTVPPYIPYFTSSDYIFGRGSNDAKASVAAQIIAALELIDAKEITSGDQVALLFVVGEEYDGIGMRKASSDLASHWDHVVFGEPTELKLGVGHKGIYHFDLKITGKSCHSGYPELGVDANMKLIDLLHKIIHAELPEDPLLGKSTINSGLIDGGVAGNVISPIAKAKILIRVAKDAQKVQKIIEEIIQAENEQYNNIQIKELQLQEPVYLDHDVPNFENTVVAYFTDVPNLSKDSVKSRFLYGPGSIMNAHTSDEHVAVLDLVGAVEGYKNLIRHLLQQN